MIAFARIVIGALVSTTLVGCRHAAPRIASGEGTFTFVSPPEQNDPHAKPTTQRDGGAGVFVMPAEPILPLVAPTYPPAALRAHSGRVTVGVRIMIDVSGRVSGVGTSMAAFSSPNSYVGGFREAVETAVRQWRFRPAVLQRVDSRKGVGGGDVLFLESVEKTEWSFDVSFTFTASGDVWSGLERGR
jgi:hypothetical protein